MAAGWDHADAFVVAGDSSTTIEHDLLLQVEVQSEVQATELKGMLGLALQLESLQHPQPAVPALQLPVTAAFSSMVPDLMQVAHK